LFPLRLIDGFVNQKQVLIILFSFNLASKNKMSIDPIKKSSPKKMTAKVNCHMGLANSKSFKTQRSDNLCLNAAIQ